MCWNWQVSLLTWLVAFAASLYLFQRKRPYDVTFGLLLLVYSSMQFWEFLMWRDQACGTMNAIATIAAYFALYAHAFAFGLGLFLEFGYPWPMLVGLAVLAVGVALMPSSFGCSVPTKTCGHLTWGFDTRYYSVVFVVCFMFGVLYVHPLMKGLGIALIFLLSLIFSAVFIKKGGVASFWCFIAAAAGPLFIVGNR